VIKIEKKKDEVTKEENSYSLKKVNLCNQGRYS